MKILLVLLFMTMSIIAFAQNPSGTNEADMKNMMMQMQKMQSCVAEIGQEKINALEQRSNQFMEATQTLCANGKRGEAQKKAISFAKEMANNAVIKTMKKCTDIMPEISNLDQFIDDPKQHICNVKNSM